jgi:hypothetical protein
MIPVNFSSLANLGNVWNQAQARADQQKKTLADLAKNQPLDNYLQGPKGQGGGQGFSSGFPLLPGIPPELLKYLPGFGGGENPPQGNAQGNAPQDKPQQPMGLPGLPPGLPGLPPDPLTLIRSLLGGSNGGTGGQ